MRLPGLADRALDREVRGEEGAAGHVGVYVVRHLEDGAGPEIDGVGLQRHAHLARAGAGEEARHLVLAVADVVARDALVVGHGRVASAPDLGEVGAGLVAHLLFHVLRPGRLGSLLAEPERGVAKVVVLEHERAGPDLVSDLHLVDVLLLLGGVGVLVVGDGLAAPGPVLGLVAEDELGLLVGVLEEVGDARLLEEAGEEGEVALAVLDLELELGVAAAIDLPAGRDLPLAEQAVDDVGDGEVLEDAVPAALGEQPQHGDDLELVGGEPGRGLGLGLRRRGADARPEPHRLEGVLDRAHDAQAGGLADERLEVEARVPRVGPDRHVEERRDGLVDGEATHVEGALAGREEELEERHRGRTFLGRGQTAIVREQWQGAALTGDEPRPGGGRPP